jgi:Uma2 family endonuclease
MSTTVASPDLEGAGPPPAAVPDEPIWRFSVEQYHEMLRAGILRDGDPVELLEGVLTAKMTKYPPHTFATQVTQESLRDLVPAGWFVNVQEPITTFDSEPEPDVAVIRGRRKEFQRRHPAPADVALVVEVADATIRRDRGRKKRLYSRAGIREYWIVNLIDHQIEVYTNPSGPVDDPDYGEHRDYAVADMVPVLLDGCEVGRLAVADVIGTPG